MSDTKIFNVNSYGYISLDSIDIKTKLQDLYKSVFGEQINLVSSSPQGQIINIDTALLENTQASLLQLCNSFNVNYSEGEALNSIGALFGYYRKTATRTIVYVDFSGEIDTIIPQGTLVKDKNNNYFETLYPTIIGENGKASNILCQALEKGKITVLANEINILENVIEGITAVNNPYNSISGTDGETDNAFKERITQNIYNIKGVSILGSLEDKLKQLDNVIDVRCRENNTDEYKIIDNINMERHSIYISILGGRDDEIAQIIAEKKTIGTSMNGDYKIGYTDNITNQTLEYKIYRPSPTELYLNVKYKENINTTQDITERIKDTIITYINDNPFKIGSVVSCSLLSKAFKDFNLADILTIEVSRNDGDYTEYLNSSVLEYFVINREKIKTELINNL